MKKTKWLLLATALFSLASFSCNINNNSDDDDDDDNNSSSQQTTTTTETTNTATGVYANFYNYPTGKANSTGTLTLKNKVQSEVLVFTSSVSAENYIATIPAMESVQVKLAAGKFYNIVAVQKSVYEEDTSNAAQTSKLAYYSDTQAYTISVSPENVTGSATWTFNNSTNYWVSVEKLDNSGETYAVIAPNAKLVTIPVQSNANYPYKLVYQKELKYRNMTIAVAEKTDMSENDVASFSYTNTHTTYISGTATSEYDDLAPSVQFINNCGKSVQVKNGQVIQCNAGVSSDDYWLASGVTAYFTNFTDGTSATALNAYSPSWDSPSSCTETSVTFEKGKVYIITLKANTGTDKATKPVLWTVTEKAASEFYAAE